MENKIRHPQSERLTESEVKALRLIASNPSGRALLPEGHALINHAIGTLLVEGAVRYAPDRAVGYRVTGRGIVLARTR